MKKKVVIENIFDIPHYKSILNLLIEFQNHTFQGKRGLRPVHFRYILEPNYKSSKDYILQNDLKKFFQGYLDELISTGRIKPGCIKSAQALAKFLKTLRQKPIEAIEKQTYKTEGQRLDVRYTIKKDFFNTGVRIQNQQAIEIYHPDQIMMINNNTKDLRNTSGELHTQHILYGLSEDVLQKMNETQKESLKKSLKTIKRSLKHIDKLKTEIFTEYTTTRIAEFLHSTKSIPIKNALKQNGFKLWIIIQDAMTYNIELREPGVETLSKTTFFHALGWIFDVLDDNKNKTGMYIPVIYSSYGDRLLEQFLKKSKKDLSSKEVKQYCTEWSANFFFHDYRFSIEDIEEIITWCWENRDFYNLFYPLPVAFSRFAPIQDNEILNKSSKHQTEV